MSATEKTSDVMVTVHLQMLDAIEVVQWASELLPTRRRRRTSENMRRIRKVFQDAIAVQRDKMFTFKTTDFDV